MPQLICEMWFNSLATTWIAFLFFISPNNRPNNYTNKPDSTNSNNNNTQKWGWVW